MNKEKEKENGPRFVLELSERQLIYVQNALEEHFRLRMGQVNIGELTDDLAMQNVDLSAENPAREKEFDAYIERRDRGLEKLREYMEIVLGRDLKRYQKTQEVINEIDLWAAIRHFRWTFLPESDKDKMRWHVASDVPYQWGDEPLPKISKASGTISAGLSEVIERVRSLHPVGSTTTINGGMFCDGWESACDELIRALKDDKE